MAPSRLPRFKRSSQSQALRLTRRDRGIIQHVHRHRFLRSSHIAALVQGSHQQVLRRLQLLYHHGFLERPRAQLDYYHQGGSREIIYGLGNKGGLLLTREFDLESNPRWGPKNRSLGRPFLEHAVLVSDVMVALELRCRESKTLRLVGRDQLSSRKDTGQGSQPFKWDVRLEKQVKLGVVPDQVFALEKTAPKPKENAFFFLEADRGTMPIVRKNLSQSSFYRKLLAYEATWKQEIHKARFGFHRFRVLTITKNAARLKSLLEACSQLKSGHRLFLFADIEFFKQQDDLLTMPWQAGRLGETSTLLE